SRARQRRGLVLDGSLHMLPGEPETGPSGIHLGVQVVRALALQLADDLVSDAGALVPVADAQVHRHLIVSPPSAPALTAEPLADRFGLPGNCHTGLEVTRAFGK